MNRKSLYKLGDTVRVNLDTCGRGNFGIRKEKLVASNQIWIRVEGASISYFAHAYCMSA